VIDDLRVNRCASSVRAYVAAMPIRLACFVMLALALLACGDDASIAACARACNFNMNSYSLENGCSCRDVVDGGQVK
jgi:hypothetical protein